jgi:hypothetical protein
VTPAGPVARRAAGWLLAATALCALTACGPDAGRPPPRSGPPAPPPDTSFEITQVLIGYRVEGRTPFTRTRAEAYRRAQQALDRALAGEPLERLVLEMTDDRDPEGQPFNRGSYTLPKSGGPQMKVLQDAVRATPVGRVHEAPVDTGLAYVVFRRDR